MTSVEVAQRGEPEVIGLPPDVEHRVGVAPSVARALTLLTARLRERHPTVPAQIVERCVNDAACRLMDEARIHDYLPILIERRARASLDLYRPEDRSAHGGPVSQYPLFER